MQNQNTTGEQAKPVVHPPETVGREYTVKRYAVHSRRKAGDGGWYGASHYKTIEAAQQAIADTGKPILGGLVSFAGNKEEFDYRIVEQTIACKVVHVEKRMV